MTPGDIATIPPNTREGRVRPIYSGHSSVNLPKPLLPLQSFSQRHFEPPSAEDTPDQLFTSAYSRGPWRAIRITDPRQALIHTDGACVNNGHANAVAGWAVVFSLHPPLGESTYIAGRLEDEGPNGNLQEQTSNQAELHAIIAALRFRDWKDEGFTSLVLATDSEHVVHGITIWIAGWIKNGWLTSNKTPVKNQDPWKLLLKELEEKDRCGVDVLFWRIDRSLNRVADARAKAAAGNMNTSRAFAKVTDALY